MARLGRPPKQWAAQTEDHSEADTVEAVVDTVEADPIATSLQSRLTHRPGDSAPTRAALDAIAQSLQDLKSRTASVAQHLGPEHAGIVETIKTL